MERTRTRWSKAWLFPIVGFALIAASACNSSPASTSGGGSSASGNAHIDMNCLGNRIENPPEAFHYSYKADGRFSVDKEAEITPQSMNITIQDNSGSHTYRGTRSDSVSWDKAVLDLSGSGLTAMIARLDFIKDKSAVVRASAEPMNGYDTTKYSIDTANANSSDKNTYATLFGGGSYEKGAIWVTDQGCPAKLLLDEGSKGANGSVDKVHYELAMIKK
jgi:hypothetical protein